ncbi:hypothetical protein O181_071921 [Austropuccinia psidii MF-1]|uniref:Uncharacterized protein n=1 Tax=Austropuccinia psidii MF-1 TaxID=1389203 RepID=A0A9Q3F878_9BASI|nr:hypothetical protein [Austropuccinia psidii MF-1]
MSPVHLRNLGFQKNQPEDTLDTMVDGKTLREIIPILPFTFQFKRNLKPEYWKDMDQGPAPPTPQRFISMEHGQKEVQLCIPLGRTCNKLPEDLAQRDRLQRPYDNHQRLESHQEFQTPGCEGKWDTPGKILSQSLVIDFTSRKREAG